ncbi:putative cytoplasmic protein [Novosphingobium sp. PP1Y]|nr:putative cytoplasmic protein [Novosphingobium sp. PP1Y]
MVWGRTPAKCCEAVGHLSHAQAVSSLSDIVDACDVVAIAVADDAIPEIVRAITEAGALSQAPLVFHVSGGSGTAVLEPLRQMGAQTAAIHPAMTFTGDPKLELERMAGSRFAVTGSSPESSQIAQSIVEALGGISVEVPEAHRALYHAALCHAANHLVTLFAGASHALRAAGVEDPAGLLAPLACAALENSIANGFDALSGPVLRGDTETIRRHLAALEGDCPELLPTYRAMALATVEELERRGDAFDRSNLLNLLCK